MYDLISKGTHAQVSVNAQNAVNVQQFLDAQNSWYELQR